MTALDRFRRQAMFALDRYPLSEMFVLGRFYRAPTQMTYAKVTFLTPCLLRKSLGLPAPAIYDLTRLILQYIMASWSYFYRHLFTSAHLRKYDTELLKKSVTRSKFWNHVLFVWFAFWAWNWPWSWTFQLKKIFLTGHKDGFARYGRQIFYIR